MELLSERLDDARRIADATSGEHALSQLGLLFDKVGLPRHLVTGLPMPGRLIDGMVLRQTLTDGYAAPFLAAGDPVFRRALVEPGPFKVERRGMLDSSLLAYVAEIGHPMALVVPFRDEVPFQGCVVAVGPGVEALGPLDEKIVDIAVRATFRRLVQLGRVATERAGGLSSRERRVMELTALGKTASEIAEDLEISQRTVHAHLQNASDKLRASNKTQTVVEALRYNQIRL